MLSSDRQLAPVAVALSHASALSQAHGAEGLATHTGVLLLDANAHTYM